MTQTGEHPSGHVPLTCRRAHSFRMRAFTMTLFLVLLSIIIAVDATDRLRVDHQEVEPSISSELLQDLSIDPSQQQQTSLRGTLYYENKQLNHIRQKLRVLHDKQRGEQSTSNSDPWRAWAALTDDELSILSHDSSCLNRRGQRALSSAYLGRRRTSVKVVGLNVGSVGPLFLRGKIVQETTGSRSLSSWTTHGDVNEVPGSIVNGEVVFNIPGEEEEEAKPNSEFMMMSPDSNENNNDADGSDDAEMQDLYARLTEAMKVTKELDEMHAHYDTNSLYTYSNPGGPPLNPDETNTNGDNMPDQMVQNAALDSDRQRLLTGSYAVWQWYDRDNLASPTNIDFTKLSRVNYAFFQTDGDGYIFGTDSWADPNVLFGPYDFSVGSDKLKEECKGGRGRQDGVPKNATVDASAIYTKQPASSGGAASGSNNRRAQSTQSTDSGNTAASGGGGKNKYKYPDFTKDPPCEVFEQCHRNFPNSKTCNVHKYKEGLIHMAHTDGAQVYPSIGGWTLSTSFPAVAADPEKRTRFARECVGLIADYGFDGIDIDWEYPGYEPHGGSPDDRKNFNELLLAIRVALNEYQTQTGDAPIGGGAFGLTAALPCGPANIDFLDVAFLSQVLSGMNLMTFDFHNEQEPLTGVNAPLYDQGWGEKSLSVDGCVKNFYKAGAAGLANKISIGVPFYGKTYAVATELNAPHSNTNGLFGGNVDQANWPQDLGTPVFYNMLDTMVKGSMVCKRHAPSKTEYAYFKDGSGLVTYDDTQAVCNKAEYVNQNLLGGMFIWELSGDMLDSMATPLLDTINRKLEELNFDCSIMATPPDCSLPELPPPSPKGSAQVETNLTVVEGILDHLAKAESGELTLISQGQGAFTRTVFMMRAYDGSLFPSYVYRYEHFVQALSLMATTGVDGDLFYLGQIDNAGRRTSRHLQAVNTTTKPTKVTSLVYGLVNVAVFLAQAMTESIIHDACDEVNIQPLANSTTDGIGLDDGHDHFRFPISNACGQNGRSYQDEQCKKVEDSVYDCATQLNIEEFAAMEVTAFSYSRWGGAPRPFYCGPKSTYQETGFWDAAVGKENDTVPLANDDKRTDVESCCWWGRGCLLSVKGTCLLGKLNYHLGANKAKRDGKSSAMFPDVDFCLDPGQICAGLNSTKLRWVTGMYHWIDQVQHYNEDGFNYLEELDKYVDDNLDDENFFKLATKIHLFGCHLDSCLPKEKVPDMDARVRNFEKVLSAFNLQFSSYAKAEPPFKTFPGQVPPTKPPKSDEMSKAPTGSPISSILNVVAQVKVYLTGVPASTNMTAAELKIFDTLMLDLLVPRLETVDVDVSDVKTVSQKPDSDYVADSNFAVKTSDGSNSVLEVILNVTLSYKPPEPDGWRDWSIYLKSWIESFGNTVVDIFTSPKNPQHPQTNSKFWNGLADVSAANVPPRKEVFLTEEPTLPPTFIIYPSQTPENKAIMGLGVGVGVLAFFLFVGFACYKYRKVKQENMKRQKNAYDDASYEFSRSSRRHRGRGSRSRHRSRGSGYSRDSRSRGAEYRPEVYEKLLSQIEEASEEDSSSSSSSSSESSSSSSESASSEDESSEEEESIKKIANAPARSSSKSSKSFNSAASTKSKSTAASAASTRSNATTDSIKSTDSDLQEYMDLVRSVAANDPKLKQIILDNKKQIGYRDGGQKLWDALIDNQYVELLSLRNSNIEDDLISELSLALLDNRSISQLWLENNHITNEGAHAIITTLEGNSKIQDVRLEGNPHIDPRLIEDIRSLLEEASVSTDEENNLDVVIEHVLENKPSMKNLKLSGMNIGSMPDALFDALATNVHIRVVDLSSNELDDDCASSLSIALMENTSIVHLNLADNLLTSEGAEYLIGLLDTNTTIKGINLGGNDIEDGLLRDIDDLLRTRQIASSSSVASSSVAYSSASSVPQASESQLAGVVQSLLANDPNLVELHLDDIDLTNCPEAEQMMDALIGNTAVETLSLNNTNFDDGLAASLSLSLVENSTITHIYLQDNLITNEGCEYLLGTLDSNDVVSCLELNGNYIDDSLLDEIESILAGRRTAETIQSKGSVSGAEVKPPMHEVPEETEIELAKRKSILGVMKNTILSWPEKNKQILEIQQKHYVPKDAELETATEEGTAHDVQDIICKVGDNNPGLTEVNLDGRNISKEDVVALCKALEANTYVTSLSLQRNKIDNDGAAALCRALEENTTLHDINLSENEITSNAAISIISVLRESNDTLQHLELKYNKVRSGLLSQLSRLLDQRRAGSVSSASVSIASRVSSVASSFMRRSAKGQDKKASAKIAGKEVV